MSSKQMKTHEENRGSGFKMENEPEEGEIVDDYDLIVSSDEELSMRQRIRQLEAENEEIEQITVISGGYSDKIHPISNHIEKSYAAQMPTDVSSISSTDFVSPKKRKRKKSRERKRKHCNYQHQHSHHHQHQRQQHVRNVEQLPHLPPKQCPKKAHCKRRQKLYSMSHQKSHSNRYSNKEIRANSVSLESLDSSDSSSSLADSDSYSRNYLPLSRKDDARDSVTYITRDTLRLAVARNSFDSRLKPKKSCLKDKLLKQEHVTNEILNCKVQNVRHTDFNNDEGDNDDDDDDVQVIETEPDIQTVDEDSSDSMEEKELRLIALKSAVLKKHMARKMRNAEAAYSPTDFDDMLSSSILQQDQNIDDLDVIDLEDDEDSQNACIIVSPEASPQLKMLDDQEESQQMVDCKPIDMDIVNSDSDDTTIDSWPKEAESEKTLPSYSIIPQDFSNQFQYGYYMHDLQELPSKPPPPPGVDDYEDTPPPTTYHKLYNSEMRDMELDNNEECSEMQRLSEASSNYYQQTNESKEMPYDSVCNNEAAEAEDEEEEEALRALLLSKFQSPKNQIKCKKVPRSEEQRSLSADVEMLERSSDSSKILKPTEFILKEAVKRLKVHSQNDNLKETEPIIDSNGRNQYSSYQRESCKENNYKSSILLTTLRNRLLKCKDQNKTIDYDEKGIEVDENVKKHDSENYSHKYNTSVEECGTESKPEITNVIDISDITRRLQKIKEDVLSKQLPKAPLTNFNETTLIQENKSQEFVEEFTANTQLSGVNQQQYESKINLFKPIHNNNVDVVQASNTIEVKNAATGGNKTIEANFDENTNQTTLRVTIKNVENVNAGDKKKLNVSNSIIPYKEINAPEVVKSTNKTDIINDGSAAETLNKSTKIKTVTKTLPTVVNKPAIVKPAIKVPQAPAATTYSTVRTTKIVKPNKVINTNIDLKRREFPKTSDPSSAPKAIRQDQSVQSTNTSDNKRLITSIDQVKHMCKVASFVISVQNSSNESSGEDEWDDCDSLYKPLSEYNDNASPLSLNLESPSLTPLRSNSPTDQSLATQNNTDMEKKIELKSETETDSLKNSKVNTTLPKSDDSITAGETSKTPLAVRHLPVSAQSEYRRLVHRMMLLENKRKSTLTGENKSNNIGEKNEEAEAANKSSLVKKVLIRNASNSTSPTGLVEKKKDTPGSTKFSNTNVLRSYENLYVKIGAGIVSNLDKSLKLVEEAKKAKIEKIKLDNRIKKLKAELEELQAQQKEEQQKISRIYPSICTTNEVITSLKQKRTQIFKAAINLGKTIKGDDYRLNNDLKETINSKSKQLANEIKMVNSLKIQDVSSTENSAKPHKTKELTTDNPEIVDDCKAKLVSENSEKPCLPDAITDDSMPNSKGDKEENEEKCEASTTTQASVNTQFGGNTEFQNMESNSTIKNTNETENGLSSHESLKVMGNSNCDGQKTSSLTSYTSPLEHLRNINSDMDPNGVVCPYDLMGNCEDPSCKYVHISAKAKS